MLFQELSNISQCNVCICLMCGIPASGKSSLLKSIIHHKKTSPMPSQYVVLGIEYDTILPVCSPSPDEDTWNTNDDDGTWKKDRCQILELTKAYLQHISHHGVNNFCLMNQPKNVKTDVWLKFSTLLNSAHTVSTEEINQTLLVIDDNMYFRSMRYEYYKLAREYGTGFCQIYLECSIEKAVQRNGKRETESQVSDDVIIRMATKMEPPNSDKYHWEKNSITVVCESALPIEIFQLLEGAFMNPVQPVGNSNDEEKSQSQIECSANLLHQADLILRKCISSSIGDSNKPPDEYKAWSKKILLLREKILREMRNGRISLALSKDCDVQNSALQKDSEFYKVIEDLYLSEFNLIS